MTTPNLRALLTQAGDVLGAWGAALEQTRREAVANYGNFARVEWPYMLGRTA